MKILLVNDDGIDSPGLWELQRALPGRAETIVVAPATEQSGKGAGVSLPQPISARRREGFPCEAWSVEGTPADCVTMAITRILSSPPDLIVSGINPGSNAGVFVFSSGTVGGVIAGTLHGVPGIAFSAASMSDPQFARFAPHVSTIIEYATVTHPIPKGTLLNVTFPHPRTLDRIREGQIAGIRFTRQGTAFNNESEHPDCDTYWLTHGYITIVPVYVGDLTHSDYLQRAQQHTL